MATGTLTDPLRETLACFDGSGTPLTTPEVAEALDLGRRSTYDRLDRLVDHDRLRTKKVGASARVWWQPVPVANAPGRRATETAPAGSSAETDAGRTSAETVLDRGPVQTGPAAPSVPTRRLDQVLDDAGVGVVLFDENHEVVAINEATERYFDLDREAVVGRDRRRLVEEDLAEVVEDSDAVAERVLGTADDGSADAPVECRITGGGDRAARWLEHRSKPVERGAHADCRLDLFWDVTDRTEAAARVQREEFESLVEAVEEYAIFRLDPDGRVATWNRGAAQIKGYDRDDVVGKHISVFYTDADVDAGIPEANLEAAAEAGSVEDEGWRIRADGTRFWAKVAVSAIYDEDGVLEGYLKVTRDMTERHEYEEQLREQRDLTREILETAPVGVLLTEADGTFVTANDRATELLDLEREGEGPWLVGIKDVYDEDGAFIPPADRPYYRAFETGEGVRNWHAQVEQADGSRRWLSTNVEPMGSDGTPEQVLVTVEDVTQLKEQARRLQRQRDEIESELADIFERVDDAFIALDDEFRITYVNDTAAAILDLSMADRYGESVWETFPEAVDSTFHRQYERAMATQEPVSFTEYFDPHGAWYEVNAYPSPEGLSIYFRDVTERKEREQELIRYETLFAESTDVALIVDADGTFETVTPSAEKVLGYLPEELQGEVAFEYMHPDDRPEAKAEFAAMLEDPDYESTMEYRFRHRDGSWLVLEAMARNLVDDPDIGGLVVYTRDVTERQEREQELQRYVGILEAIGEPVYELDASGRFTFVNEAFVEQSGYAEAELLGSNASMAVAEDSLERLESAITDHLADDADDPLVVEYELLPKDGDPFPVENRISLLTDEDGSLRGTAGALWDVSERKAQERELRSRVRQQEAVASLGQRALEGADLEDLLAEAAEVVAETLDTDYCKVLDLEGDELLLRQGVGWDEGLVGQAAVSAVEDASQAAYTLESEQAVRVTDLATEERFSGTDLLRDHDVRSGISVLIGPTEEPWGILGTHDTRVREFSDVDVTFVRSVANVLADAIERHEYEARLMDQREQLAALNDLNEVAREVTDAVIDQSTRAEIEETVCEHLAASHTYEFAWIGDVNPGTDTVSPRTTAGVEADPDDITVSLDPDEEVRRCATASAWATGAVQTVQDFRADDRSDPLRDHAEASGIRSSAAIPIGHEETTFGILTLHSARAKAFEGREAAVLGQLGEVIGHAIAAIERKRALLSDEIVDLEFLVRDFADALDAAVELNGRIVFEDAVPLTGDDFLGYGTVTAEAVEGLQALATAVPHWSEFVLQEEPVGEAVGFTVRLSEPPVLSVLTSLGGLVDEAVVEEGDYRMTLHLPPTAETRLVVDAVREAYPSVELVRRKQRTRIADTSSSLEQVFGERLTDRQQSALRAAYRAGFYQWPRGSTGEEIADSLGVSPPTFHQHLRKAEGKIFETILTTQP